MDITPTAAPASGKTGFEGALQELPGTLTLLSGAVTAVLAFLAPDYIFPSPLTPQKMQFATTIFIVLALCTAWVIPKKRYARPGRMIAITGGAALTFVLLLLSFVHEVPYKTPEGVVVRDVLVGFYVVMPEFVGVVPSEIVRTMGTDPGELRKVWGLSYTAVVLAYPLAYFAMVVGVLLSLEAAQASSRRLPRARPRSSRQQP